MNARTGNGKPTVVSNSVEGLLGNEELQLYNKRHEGQFTAQEMAEARRVRARRSNASDPRMFGRVCICILNTWVFAQEYYLLVWSFEKIEEDILYLMFLSVFTGGSPVGKQTPRSRPWRPRSATRSVNEVQREHKYKCMLAYWRTCLLRCEKWTGSEAYEEAWSDI